MRLARPRCACGLAVTVPLGRARIRTQAAASALPGTLGLTTKNLVSSRQVGAAGAQASQWTRGACRTGRRPRPPDDECSRFLSALVDWRYFLRVDLRVVTHLGITTEPDFVALLVRAGWVFDDEGQKNQCRDAVVIDDANAAAFLVDLRVTELFERIGGQQTLAS